MAMLCDSFSANGSNYYSEQPNGNTANLHQQYLYGQLHHRKSYNSFCERAGSLGVFSSLRWTLRLRCVSSHKGKMWVPMELKWKDLEQFYIVYRKMVKYATESSRQEKTTKSKSKISTSSYFLTRCVIWISEL